MELTEETVELIEQLAKIVSKHKLDKIKIGDLEICKAKHEIPKAEKSPHIPALISDEDLLYMSGAPALTAEEIEAYTDRPMPLPATKRSKKKD